MLQVFTFSIIVLTVPFLRVIFFSNKGIRKTSPDLWTQTRAEVKCSYSQMPPRPHSPEQWPMNVTQRNTPATLYVMASLSVQVCFSPSQILMLPEPQFLLNNLAFPMNSTLTESRSLSDSRERVSSCVVKRMEKKKMKQALYEVQSLCSLSESLRSLRATNEIGTYYYICPTWAVWAA